MKLSIVTINYNGSERTIKLLKSFAEQTDQDFQIIVLDNASGEADFNALKNSCPTSQDGQFKLIRNEENLGFSGGNNVGIRKAVEMGADWVFLLNNDTWVGPGFIVSLKAKLSQSGGIVGIPLVEDDRTAPSTMLRTSYCGKIEWLKPTLEHAYKPVSLQTDKLNDYYAIGGGVAVHRDVFNKIGLMDEKYFLYFEDADLSIRAQKAGFRLTFLEEPKAYHQVSSTTKKLGSPLLLRYHYRNAIYFNFKNGPWYIKILVWPWSFWIIAKQVFKIMIYHNRDQSLAILRGVFDFYKGKMGQVVDF